MFAVAPLHLLAALAWCIVWGPLDCKGVGNLLGYPEDHTMKLATHVVTCLTLAVRLHCARAWRLSTWESCVVAVSKYVRCTCK